MRLLYNKKVKIIRITSISDDGIGGKTGVESVHLSNVACYIRPVTGTERETFKKEGYVRSFVMYCNVIDLKVKDLIVDNGNKYEILDVVNTRNEFLIVDLSLVS